MYSRRCAHGYDLYVHQQADQKSESWKMEEARRRAIGSDYAKSLGLQQALEDEKSKGR
jgi:hypothetical protein